MHANFAKVALIGRPNVGKSRLFNRIVGNRITIVHDQPGVTRDIVSASVKDEFVLMDTGGIGYKNIPQPTKITEKVEEQVEIALNEVDLVLFVVDGKEGCMHTDLEVARKLRKWGKMVLVVINKIDNPNREQLMDEFFALGFPDPIRVSAEHNKGIDFLMEAIKKALSSIKKDIPDVTNTTEKSIKFCFIGKPNVGKSSLINALLKDNKVIVSDIPGTTRDAVEVGFSFKLGKDTLPFTLVDTAGLRYRKKQSSSVEYFSSLRTRDAAERSSVVFLVVDALGGVTKLDKKVMGEIVEMGRGVVIIVNKWDIALKTFQENPLSGYKNEKDFRDKFEKFIRKEMFFLSSSPIIFTSATEAYGIETILSEANVVWQFMNKRLSTSKINQTIQNLMDAKAPTSTNSRKRFKVYYATQSNVNPVTIKTFCNKKSLLEDGYKRYLENGMLKAFGLKGCPIKFEFIEKENRFTQDD